MHKKLIIDAFEKVKEDEIKKGVLTPSKTHISKVLSCFIQDEMDFNFGERSLKNYYNSALKKKAIDGDINILRLQVVLGLCKCLEFDDYQSYIRSISTNRDRVVNGLDFNSEESIIKDKSKKKNLLVWFSKPSVYNKILLKGIFAVVITTIYFYENQLRWMVWDEDHYVEVKYDFEKYDIGQLRLYNKDRINHFRKIIPDCDTDFFNSKGDVKIWYAKNIEKDLEYFTALGLHPETGKVLDPITIYMIRKYICSNY